MFLRKYIRRHMYRWHRIASLTIALPVLLWAFSGFMHPLMTNIRPQVATQRLSTTVIDTSKIKVSLADALLKNRIDTFSQFRLVVMSGNWFYQVTLPGNKVLKYYSAENGKLLPQGMSFMRATWPNNSWKVMNRRRRQPGQGPIKCWLR